MRINPDAQQRPIFEIAAEIRRTWKDVNFAAEPYLEVMEALNLITDVYGYDSSEIVVCTFLSNARAWKGEDAHRIKNELRAMVGLPLSKAPKPRAPKAKAPVDDAARAQRKADAAVVRSLVSRVMFCPFTGDLLDMRRAVVISTPTETFVCTGAHWDESLARVGGLDAFTAIVAKKLGRPAQIKVYDGRLLYTPAGRVR